MPKLVLVVDDESRFRSFYAGRLRSIGLEVHTESDAEGALKYLEQSSPDMIISDVRMPGASGLELLQKVRMTRPDLPFLIVTAFADVRDAVRALKLGAVNYLTKPIDLDELADIVSETLKLEENSPVERLNKDALVGIIVESPAMMSLFRDAYRVADSDATVLLRGESGTGKEVLASFIHRNSRRSAAKLVAINCAAIPVSLLASELFGHEKGAFTGATSSRHGRFKDADGGTLFLDEIGDLPVELQPALLRAIDLGEITPVGKNLTLKVDFRLIAATNRDLRAKVKDGSFREDLYYRLNVVEFEIPPLRHRKEEIKPLARHFLNAGGNIQKRFSAEAIKLLEAYNWPGNVRELANAAERARIMSNTDIVLPECLPSTIGRVDAGKLAENIQDARTRTLEQSEKEEIARTLVNTDGNRTKAAEKLGISRRALIYKIKRYGLH